MLNLTVIGDPHGNCNRYKEITDACDFSISVGDFGFKKQYHWHVNNIYAKNPFEYKGHFINGGNHEYMPMMEFMPYLGHHCYFPEIELFSVRGANSIDKHLRTEGIDWFPDEELNYGQQLAAYDKYVETKPRIVISHDCPQEVMKHFFGYSETSQTRTMLQHMFEAHKPEIHIFGHHHSSRDEMINGTRFICLAELETFKIEL